VLAAGRAAEGGRGDGNGVGVGVGSGLGSGVGVGVGPGNSWPDSPVDVTPNVGVGFAVGSCVGRGVGSGVGIGVGLTDRMFDVSGTPTWPEEICFLIRGSVIVRLSMVMFLVSSIVGVPVAACFAGLLIVELSGPVLSVVTGALIDALPAISLILSFWIIDGKARLENTGVRETSGSLMLVCM
jgi:hypothetical protein